MRNHNRLIEPGQIVIDQDLLRLLRGRRLSAQLRHLCVIGAHRFDEKRMVDGVFPALQSIALFEPLETPRRQLEAIARSDQRVRVFPYAVTDQDGQARFNVASNDGGSSSLLDFGTHRQLFPDVHFERTIDVSTRRLSTALSEQKAAFPDVLIVDVQGAEYRVLSSLGDQVLAGLRLIFAEVSTEAVYQGARPLEEVERLLSPRFVNLGYAPLTPATPTHGNAVFVRREDVRAALSFTLEGMARKLEERLKRAWRS